MHSLRSLRVLLLAVALIVGAAVAVRPALAQGTHVEQGHAHDDHNHHPGDGHDHGAAGHGDHGHETPGVLPTAGQGIAPMIVSLIVFGLVFAVLSATAWPKIVKGLKDREEKIRSEIEAAEMAQQQAKAALQEYERNLAQARAEAQRMLDEAKSQQQAIAAELKAKSEVELNAMREKAKRDIETAKRAAIDEVYTHAASAAGAMAAKILKREIGAQDQQRLIQESLSELQAAVARSN